MYFCFYSLLNISLIDAVNKGNLKINNICMQKENKEQTYIIPLNSKRSINYIEDIIEGIFQKNEPNKKLGAKLEKEKEIERQNYEEANKKYLLNTNLTKI